MLLSQVPTEVLLEIFHYLDFRDLVNIETVNSEFKQLSCQCVKKVDLSGFFPFGKLKMKDDIVLRIINKYQRIESISFRRGRILCRYPDKINLFKKVSKNLKERENPPTKFFFGGKIDDQALCPFLELLGSSIKEIDLIGSAIGEVGVASLTKYCHKIEKFSFGGFLGKLGVVLEYPVQRFSSLGSLAKIAEWSTLKELSLCRFDVACKFEEEFLRPLLKNSKKLEKFWYQDLQYVRTVSKETSEVLFKNCKKLKSIKFDVDGGMKVVFQEYASQLEHVEGWFDDDELEVLSKTCQKSLTSIILFQDRRYGTGRTNRQLTNKGIDYLSQCKMMNSIRIYFHHYSSSNKTSQLGCEYVVKLIPEGVLRYLKASELKPIMKYKHAADRVLMIDTDDFFLYWEEFEEDEDERRMREYDEEREKRKRKKDSVQKDDSKKDTKCSVM